MGSARQESAGTRSIVAAVAAIGRVGEAPGVEERLDLVAAACHDSDLGFFLCDTKLVVGNGRGLPRDDIYGRILCECAQRHVDDPLARGNAGKDKGSVGA